MTGCRDDSLSVLANRGTVRQRLYRGTGFVEHVGAAPVKRWGWGREDKVESLESRPAPAEFVRQRLHLATLTRREVARFEDIAIPLGKLMDGTT